MDTITRHWLPKFLRKIEFASKNNYTSASAILDSLGFPLAVVDRQGKIIRINKCWTGSDWRKGIFGNVPINPGDSYLETSRRAIAVGILPASGALKGIASVCDGSMAFYELEYTCSLPEGDRLFSMTVRPLLSPDGGAVIAHRNISELREADETLMDLSGQLIRAREDERNRIARELHDNLSQKMALLSIEIEQLIQPPSQSVAADNAGLSKLFDKVQDIANEIHRLSQELHPFKLDRLGLAAATLSLIKEVSSQQSLHVDCDIRDIPDGLPHDVALCLYRVIQESLQNIIKHSGSYDAVLEMHGSKFEMVLRITDQGIGFTPGSACQKHGMGFFSMREHLRLVGGTMSIESQPLRGTRIQVVVPLKPCDS